MTGFLLSPVSWTWRRSSEPWGGCRNSTLIHNHDELHPTRSPGIGFQLPPCAMRSRRTLSTSGHPNPHHRTKRTEWGHLKQLFQLSYFVMPRNQSNILQAGVRDFRTYIERRVLLNSYFLRSVVKHVFFPCSSVHWNIFSYLTASSINSNKKAFQGCVFLKTGFYFFSTCCFNFSKISSGVVEAKSFTTFSRDLPPFSKTTSLLRSFKTLER